MYYSNKVNSQSILFIEIKILSISLSDLKTKLSENCSL